LESFGALASCDPLGSKNPSRLRRVVGDGSSMARTHSMITTEVAERIASQTRPLHSTQIFSRHHPLWASPTPIGCLDGRRGHALPPHGWQLHTLWARR
jgi:hypothetical protein